MLSRTNPSCKIVQNHMPQFALQIFNISNSLPRFALRGRKSAALAAASTVCCKSQKWEIAPHVASAKPEPGPLAVESDGVEMAITHSTINN